MEGWVARIASTCFQASNHQRHMHSADKDGQRAERIATKGCQSVNSVRLLEAHTRMHYKWLCVTPPVKLDLPMDERVPSLHCLFADNSWIPAVYILIDHSKFLSQKLLRCLIYFCSWPKCVFKFVYHLKVTKHFIPQCKLMLLNKDQNFGQIIITGHVIGLRAAEICFMISATRVTILDKK